MYAKILPFLAFANYRTFFYLSNLEQMEKTDKFCRFSKKYSGKFAVFPTSE